VKHESGVSTAAPPRRILLDSLGVRPIVSPVKRVRVHLVRHGHVENPAAVIYGTLPGFGLSELGRTQARAAAAYLRARVGERAAITASPLDRALETAKILTDDLGIASAPSVDPRLLEVGSPLDGLPRRFAPVSYLKRWLDAQARARAEAPIAVARRMMSAVRAAAAAELADVILVSHQFPIRMARVGFERSLGREKAPLLATRAPWLYIRGRCSLASVTTLSFVEGGQANITYWEP
jgi:broad specificity phosphatase PhoE